MQLSYFLNKQTNLEPKQTKKSQSCCNNGTLYFKVNESIKTVFKSKNASFMDIIYLQFYFLDVSEASIYYHV